MDIELLAKLVLGIVSVAVVWLFRTANGNEKQIIKIKAEQKALGARVDKIDKDSLTSDDVRGLLDEALEKQEKTLALQIKQATLEAVGECQGANAVAHSADLERTITKVLKRLLDEHKNGTS